MSTEQADTWFENLDGLRIGQCDVHHFGCFTLPNRFCQLFEVLIAVIKPPAIAFNSPQRSKLYTKAVIKANPPRYCLTSCERWNL
jgi:hypothetical protein